MRLPRYLVGALSPGEAYNHARGLRGAAVDRAAWQKSSFSAYNGNCVQIARMSEGGVGIRDTKDQGSGPILLFTQGEWAAFLKAAQTGEFDQI